MKKASTLFLKGVIVLIGIVALGICVFLLPSIVEEMIDFLPIQYEFLPILISIAASLIPFNIALYQAIKLLNYIEKKKIFSESSIKALKNIKYCASIIGLLYLFSAPFLYIIAEVDDAPGVFAIGLIIIFASFVIATAVAVFQELLQKAVELKSENELTV